LVASNLVTRSEIESGRPAKETTIAATTPAAAPTDRETPAAPRFQTRERVRARIMERDAQLQPIQEAYAGRSIGVPLRFDQPSIARRLALLILITPIVVQAS
jgi:hypothetical protein